MQHYLFLFLAFAATNTLANPGNGYPYAVPHPEFKKRALEKRDANGKRDVNAAFQVHQAEYKAFMNVPTNYDQATAAQKQQYEQLKAEAEAKAQAAKQYAVDWQYHVQQAAAKQKANAPNADCKGFSILGQCIDSSTITDAIKAAAPAPAPAAAAPAPAAAPADPPPPPIYFASVYNSLGYPYGGGGYGYGGYNPYGGYGGYGGGCYGGGGGYPYYGGGYPGSYYGGGYPGYGGGYGGGFPNPFGCGGFNVPPGYPKPGKGKTSCKDVNNHGYICNEAYNELSYCFQTPYPYYFGFGSGGGNIGTGSVVVAKCCFFGTCAASDDGLIGYCACSAAGTNA